MFNYFRNLQHMKGNGFAKYIFKIYMNQIP